MFAFVQCKNALKVETLLVYFCGVFTLTDTKTEIETEKMACIELCGGVHATQRQKLTQTFIGFCTRFISNCISLSFGLGVAKCE